MRKIYAMFSRLFILIYSVKSQRKELSLFLTPQCAYYRSHGVSRPRGKIKPTNLDITVRNQLVICTTRALAATPGLSDLVSSTVQ